MRRCSAKTVLVESRLQTTDDFPTRYDHLARHLRATQEAASVVDVSQVTFFAPQIPGDPNALPSWVKQNDILATAIIVTVTLKEAAGSLEVGDETRYVYEAVIAIPSTDGPNGRLPILNNYYHVRDKIDVVVCGRDFDSPGLTASYFIQACRVRGVCAHACLRMALFMTDQELKPASVAEINRIAREFHKATEGKNDYNPLKGLGKQEMQRVLDELGAEMLFLEKGVPGWDKLNPFDCAYLMVESGIPTLIGFRSYSGGAVDAGDDAKEPLHLVTAVGHTSNLDEWLPMAQSYYPDFRENISEPGYVSSARWATHLLVHDDYLGAAACLRSVDLKEHIRLVAGIVPKSQGFLQPPHEVETYAAGAFWEHWEKLVSRAQGKWPARLREVLIDDDAEEGSEMRYRAHRLVLRTQRVTTAEYIQHLLDYSDHEGNTVALSADDLAAAFGSFPEYLWLVEATIPETYSANRSKFCDIILPFNEVLGASEPGDDESPVFGYLGFRMLGHVDIKGGEALILGIDSHYPLYRRHSEGYEF
jgi:hypothetical protein